MGSVERRIRGIVPPNQGIVGHTVTGGLRYCKAAATFTTEAHYYSEKDVMLTGEACVNNQRIRAEWDYSRQRDAPSLVLDRHGLRCANPDDESTCPKARRCVVGGGCHTDQPDWSDPAVLADPNIGWGERAVPFLDPTVRRDWKYVGDDYPWTSVDWGIAPTSRATG